MSKIGPLETHKYPWYVRLIFAMQKRKYGKILEPAQLWGRSPLVFLWLSMLFGALDRRKSPISPELRALLTVRVSQINHCPFCVDINSARSLERGASRDKLRELPNSQQSSVFNALERAAITYAEVITRTDGEVSPDLWAELRRHFGEDALIELTGLICFQNMSSKFNAALDVAPQGFCEIP